MPHYSYSPKQVPKIKFKVPKLNRRTLQKTIDYTACASPNILSRIACLTSAVTEWQKLAALSPAVQQHLRADKVEKAQRLAEGTSVDAEKEAALRMACRLYEKAFTDAGINRVPSVDTAYDNEKARRRFEREEAKTKGLVDAARELFQVTLVRVPGDVKEVVGNELRLGEQQLKPILDASRQYGMLAGVLGLVPSIVQMRMAQASERGEADAWSILDDVLQTVACSYGKRRARTPIQTASKTRAKAKTNKPSTTKHYDDTPEEYTGPSLYDAAALFKAGTAKWEIGSALADGNVHKLNDIGLICDRRGLRGRSVIHWVIRKLRDEGFRVLRGTDWLQVTKGGSNG
ncbi:MAG: DUF2786 domain-containing protein [Candidatus Thorarchaeota archaeon]